MINQKSTDRIWLLAQAILISSFGIAFIFPTLAQAQKKANIAPSSITVSVDELSIDNDDTAPTRSNLSPLDAVNEGSRQNAAAKTTVLATTIYYVAKSGNGSDGLSWTNAYTNMQESLTGASSGDEIWVATGVYTPGTARTDTFALVGGVEIYGGFDPASNIDEFGERDWETYPTVLSGDIDGNDGTDANGVVTDTANLSASSNSYHVITSTGAISTTVLDGFTITVGDADGGSSPDNTGGGMLNTNSSPTLANITFAGNWAKKGGGLYNSSNSSPVLTNVTFAGNSAGTHGGGMYNDSSSPTLANVTFAENSASRGGGMYNTNSSSPVLTNVTFSGNSATFGGGMFSFISIPTLTNIIFAGNSADYGGGMYNDSTSPALTLTNVTFAGNSATTTGGGMHNSSSRPAIRNTIFWSNTAGSSGTAIYNNGSSPDLTNTLIQGGCPAVVGTCYGVVLTSDPMFVRNPDSGDGDWGTLGDNDYGDLRLQSGSPAINQGENSYVSVSTDLAGNARVANKIVDLGAYETALSLLYVDDTAGGVDNGISWDNAFTDLQSALAIADSGNEIYVATGVYTPGNARTDTFSLVGGVEMYGGYPNGGGIRDWEANITVLSGDIDGNDGTDANGVVTDTAYISGLNSYHVVTSTNVLSNTVLDGFIITAGDADGANPNDYGGGMNNYNSNPTLAYLTFSGNSAANGGGMRNHSSSPTLDNVTFVGNSVTGNGGGMYNESASSPTLTNVTFSINSSISHGGGMHNDTNSNPILANVTFTGNSSQLFGGGMYNYNSSPALTHVTFSANFSPQIGGGMYNFDSSPTLTNVTFTGNFADYAGGGMANGESNSRPILANVTFVGNSATSLGGGMYNYNSSPILTNVTFAGNSATLIGGGMYNENGSSPTIRNTVFWTNTAGTSSTAAISSTVDSTVVLTNTLIQDGCPSGATCSGVLLTTDPLFERNPNAGDGDWNTLGDNDYGDLRLQSGSPAINQGDNSFVSAATDLAGNERIIQQWVDLGAYEFGARLYADHAAAGTASGLSWTNAYTNVQDALAASVPNSGYEIFVATGVYTPGNARTDTFALVGGVETYGGFDPASGIDEFGERDWKTYPTVLSGDIDGNDGKDANGVVTDTNFISGSNSYHVVSNTNVLSNTVLDGFIITAGDANGSSLNNNGGGMNNDNSSPMLINLTFSGNSAVYYGGGMRNKSSSPTLINIAFTGNSADNSGGGMNNGSNSKPTLTNVTFSGNQAAQYGGGMENFNSSPVLNNVTFSGNWANNGGGMDNSFGGIPVLTNVTFAGNSATNKGGGILNFDTSPVIRNTIFWTNTAGTRPAIYNQGSSSPVLTNMLIQDGCPVGATCNGVLFTTDPMFVRNPDSGDGDWTTLDDNDYGDLRLSANSPAINQGENSFVASVATDLDGNPRIIDGDVDLGAYEAPLTYQLTVSKDGSGNGSVSSEPAGISCDDDCDTLFFAGTVVTLTASANTGSAFSGWSGDVGGNANPLTVTITADTVATATFALDTHALTVNLNGDGSVSSDPAGINCESDCSEVYDYGTVVTLTAVISPNSTFTGWSGSIITTTNPLVLTMDEAKSVTATFALDTNTLTVNLDGNGSVSSDPAGINCESDCTETYEYGTVVTLTAVSTISSTFTGWTGSIITTTNPLILTMDEAKSVTATFDLEQTDYFLFLPLIVKP